MSQSPQPQFERPLIQRAHIAVLLSGIFASFAVAFIAFIWISIWTGLTGGGAAPHYQAELDASYVFWSAASITFFISGMNWYGFVVVIPATWLILGLLSIAFKAESKPTPARKFYIVGAVTTCLVIFLVIQLTTAPYLSTGDPAIVISALSGSAIASCMVGIPAGLSITFVYRVILRPPAYPAP